jgi:3-dehydroquinate dehydratase/shikimate dehydrogenase
MPQRTSFPAICIALGFSDAGKLLEHARQGIDEGDSFLEFRLDYLKCPDEGVKAIRELLTSHPELTILATCRRHQNHGHFNGSIDEQIQVLAASIEAGAKAVDLEIESAENAIGRLDALRGKAKLVISYHNFEGTPSMESVLRRMQHFTADIYKIVTTARKPSDNWRVLSLCKKHPRVPVIVLAMGETGLATRILSTAWGAKYTYAAPNAAEGTAPGQISSRQLRHLYRLDKFTKAAKVYGVIADPVRHSISPAVHNRAFQSRRMDAVYLPFLVHPAQLRDFFTTADELPIAGFSVTIPHKQKIIRYLDIIDPFARRIGAVNTVWKKAGKWRGTNTDAEAVTVPLSKYIKLAKSSVLLAGNGGAARSAAYALTDAGAKLAITGRNLDRVRSLAKSCGAEPLSREQLESRKFDALVHATPLGMFPNMQGCFFDTHIPAEVVFDMVYNPIETMLIQRARDQGLTVIPGTHMFLEQAAHQFEIWTGESAPRAVMEKAALEVLTCAEK